MTGMVAALSRRRRSIPKCVQAAATSSFRCQQDCRGAENPEHSNVDFFVMRTLPFGSSAADLHFNRVSYLMCALGYKMGLVWSCYYDDYPILCPTGLEQSSVGASKALFNLLGFRCAEDKLVPPADKAEILGVEVDLSESASGVVKVCSKQYRISEIEANLDEIITAGRVRPKDVPSHLGRLQLQICRWRDVLKR